MRSAGANLALLTAFLKIAIAASYSRTNVTTESDATSGKNDSCHIPDWITAITGAAACACAIWGIIVQTLKSKQAKFLGARIKELEIKCGNSENQFANKQETDVKFDKSDEQFNQQLTAIRTSVATLQSTQDSDRAKNEESFKKMQGEVSSLERKIVGAYAEIADQAKKIAQLEKELRSKSELCTSMSNQLSSETDRVAHIVSKVSTLVQKANELSQAIETMRSRIKVEQHDQRILTELNFVSTMQKDIVKIATDVLCFADPSSKTKADTDAETETDVDNIDSPSDAKLITKSAILHGSVSSAKTGKEISIDEFGYLTTLLERAAENTSSTISMVVNAELQKHQYHAEDETDHENMPLVEIMPLTVSTDSIY